MPAKPTKPARWVGLVLWAAALAPGAGGCATSLDRYEYTQRHMGTQFRVVLYAPDRMTANDAADAAFARIDRLNDQLSDYDPESELSRLSASSGQGRAVEVGEDLWKMLERSQEFSQRSEGAFDVTVGPATRLWRRAQRDGRMPREERLDEAREAIGYRHVKLDPENRTAELTVPNMRLDLGGIAKGYAADEALGVLDQHGVGRALIDAGGDVTLGDPPPGKRGWRVALEPMTAPPGQESQDQKSTLLLANASVATSGDAFRHAVIDGKRYSHIVDPRTGVGLTTRIAVTVIAPDGTTADALASAVSVLGPEAGLELVEQYPHAAAVIVRNVNGRIERYQSKRVRELKIETEEAHGS